MTGSIFMAGQSCVSRCGGGGSPKRTSSTSLCFAKTLFALDSGKIIAAANQTTCDPPMARLVGSKQLPLTPQALFPDHKPLACARV